MNGIHGKKAWLKYMPTTLVMPINHSSAYNFYETNIVI